MHETMSQTIREQTHPFLKQLYLKERFEAYLWNLNCSEQPQVLSLSAQLWVGRKIIIKLLLLTQDLHFPLLFSIMVKIYPSHMEEIHCSDNKYELLSCKYNI
jgi:hypothetical protein